MNGQTWLRQPLAVGRVVTIPVTAAAFWALHHWGGIAPTRLWLLYLILGLAGVASIFAVTASHMVRYSAGVSACPLGGLQGVSLERSGSFQSSQ